MISNHKEKMTRGVWGNGRVMDFYGLILKKQKQNYYNITNVSITSKTVKHKKFKLGRVTKAVDSHIYKLLATNKYFQVNLRKLNKLLFFKYCMGHCSKDPITLNTGILLILAVMFLEIMFELYCKKYAPSLMFTNKTFLSK